MRRSAVLTVALLFCAALASRAQVTTGTIAGTVSDATGAVLPGAKVVILNEDTGIARSVQSDAGGRYSAPSLSVGKYKVTVNAEGFQTEVHTGIELTVGRNAVVDFQLSVGAVTQTVEVSGEAPLVETSQSSVSTLVDAKTINELPLNGRNVSDLVLLQAGAEKLEVAATAVHRGFGTQISISGARTDDNLFLLDGTDMSDYQNNSPSGPNGIMYGSESTREFQVLTSNMSAQYGRAMGGVFNSVSKSGTNEFHGDAFESLRNSATDARSFFDGTTVPPFRRNQFAGSLGGPIIRDKTFFHLSYEGLRSSQSITARPSVPGVGLRQGIFPDGHRDQISPIAASIIPFWPLPTPGGRTFPDGTADYIYSPVTVVNTDYFQTRMDHQLSDKDSLFVRFTFMDQSQNAQSNTSPPGYATNVPNGSRFFTLSETRILSPRDLNSFRVAFNRNTLSQTQAALTIPPLQFFADSPFPGNFSVTGIGVNFTIGLFGPDFWANTNRYEFIDDVTLTRGNHSIHVGGNYQRAQENQNFENIPNGQYSFTSWEGFLLNQTSALGPFRGTPLSNTDTIRGFRINYFSAYFQDDWRIRPNLTLNLGVRYDFNGVPSEVNGKLSNFRTKIPGGDLAATGQYVLGNPLWQNPSTKDFAPRAGFVWAPFKSQSTSVRGGIGLFYGRLDARQYWGNRDGFIAKGYSVNTPTHFPNAALDIQSSGQTTQVFNTNFNIHMPHDWQWSLNIQRQLSSSTVLTLGYTGNRGIDLIGIANFLAPETTFINGVLTAPANGTVRNPTLATIDYTTSQGDSWFNGLTVDLRRRLAAGWQFQLAYTWSKAISTADQTSRAQLSSNRVTGYFLDPAHIDADKSLSPWDARQVVKFNSVYVLPFGSGGHWLNHGGITSAIVGGWQLSGILTLKSGSPYTYEDTVNRTLSGMSFQEARPNAKPGSPVGGVICGAPDQSKNGQPCRTYFDPNSFLFPGTLQLGNIGRLTGIAPGIATLDASLQKTFTLRERLSLQFRADAFNISNRPGFGLPGRVVFGTTGAPQATAGVISTVSVPGREFQFNVKLTF